MTDEVKDEIESIEKNKPAKLTRQVVGGKGNYFLGTTSMTDGLAGPMPVERTSEPDAIFAETCGLT